LKEKRFVTPAEYELFKAGFIEDNEKEAE